MIEMLRKTLQLSSNAAIPVVGLGTWTLQPPALQPVIERAIELGCRHIDCAAIYENEKYVGEYLQSIFKNNERFNVARNDLFIVSKLWNTKHSREDVFTAFEQTLKDLQTDYLDLYLIHWPFSFHEDERGYSKLDANGVAIIKPVPISETWAAMEELLAQGKVRSIGVSNFTATHLAELLKAAKVKPAVNQVELHPFLPQHDLLTFCEKNEIRVVAYSPLGSGKQPSSMEHPAVVKIAKEMKMTPAQVLLSWAITRGTPIIPKTSQPERLEENFDIKPLDGESMTAINAITTRFRVVNPVEFWKVDCFDGEL
ncbi:hypothetical protein PSACC_01335 [Paramicrosporidium saccamoebae]|uniref:NADP-dependent oxidoreductase domain-containing protein n=1 Tax=Paramicrosporidium saccamoebae TaxID=1246581 RepID=A0A2H9TM41_9FUNG|nr:hypothetical protein PSACC_01335 [Paramicrosporidium saccamoebae]